MTSAINIYAERYNKHRPVHICCVAFICSATVSIAAGSQISLTASAVWSDQSCMIWMMLTCAMVSMTLYFLLKCIVQEAFAHTCVWHSCGAPLFALAIATAL